MRTCSRTKPGLRGKEGFLQGSVTAAGAREGQTRTTQKGKPSVQSEATVPGQPGAITRDLCPESRRDEPTTPRLIEVEVQPDFHSSNTR